VYAKVENGVVVKYPYTEDDLRRDNPNMSLPRLVLDDIFQMLGAVRVYDTERGSDYTKNYTEKTPVVENGLYVRVWEEQDASEQEIAERLESQWSYVRSKRNKLLQGSDWTQLPDSPLDTAARNAWAEYRQALRDITGSPDPFSVQFPDEPSA